MPTVKPGGYLAIGEPFWKEWPLPRDVDDMGYVPLEETVERFTARGLTLTGLVAASVDDWDRYESLHWEALDDWLAQNPDHPQAEEFHARGAAHRRRYLRWERALLGWAILVCRS